MHTLDGKSQRHKGTIAWCARIETNFYDYCNLEMFRLLSLVTFKLVGLFESVLSSGVSCIRYII